MSCVIVKRRPDGIVEIRPRRAWRNLASPAPAGILALFAASLAALGALASAMIRFPLLLLLVGGLLLFMASAARYALQQRQPALRPVVTRSRPPLDAA